MNWTTVVPEKTAPVSRITLRINWPCAGGLSAVNRSRYAVAERRRGSRE